MDLNNVEFTWIKNIPENWKTQRVKNHFILTKNKTETPEGYPILSLTMNGIVERDISSNEGQLPETYNGYYLLDKDDIVFNPMDLISGWVDCSPFEGLISPSYKVIRPISDRVNIRFYTYYFQTHYKEKIFFPFGEGVHYEYRWGLGTETLRNFPIVVPPLLEQQKIVSFLDNKTSLIDFLIEKTQRKIELLKEKRNSLINEIVTKGLNPNVEMKDSGVEWIGDIPSHWEESQFKFYIKLRHGYQFRDGDFTDEGIKIVKITQLDKGGFLNLSKCSTIDKERLNDFENILINKNDILMCLTGGTIGKIIKVGKVDEPLLQNYRVGHFSSINEENMVNDYMFYLMSSEVIVGQIFYDVRETGQPNIGLEDMNKMRICIPPINEQKHIVEYLDKQTQLIDKTISDEGKRIELIKEYRQSLISEVVTGKRKVV
jgi:type I restriction enzyme S subunit